MLSFTTSRMEAVTQPRRWGYEVVDVFFGAIRVRKDQTVVMKGELLRVVDDESGQLFEFRARSGADLDLLQVSIRPGRTYPVPDGDVTCALALREHLSSCSTCLSGPSCGYGQDLAHALRPEPPPTHCSKCGGEKDNEGWCANYCMEGE